MRLISSVISVENIPRKSIIGQMKTFDLRFMKDLLDDVQVVHVIKVWIYMFGENFYLWLFVDYSWTRKPIPRFIQNHRMDQAYPTSTRSFRNKCGTRTRLWRRWKCLYFTSFKRYNLLFNVETLVQWLLYDAASYPILDGREYYK